MTATALERANDGCVKHPEGAHQWLMFPGGYGCALCPAWVSITVTSDAVDPLPTRFPAFHHSEPGFQTYRVRVPEQPDIDIRIMAELLTIADERKVTFGELEQLTARIIEIAQS